MASDYSFTSNPSGEFSQLYDSAPFALSSAASNEEQGAPKPHIAVVIPAYNESSHITEVLSRIPEYVTSIIVVNDASTDDTCEVIQHQVTIDPRIILLSHNQNQGVGGAMVTGLKYAVGIHADIVVKMDADGQMSVDDLPSLLAPILNGSADYAKGNRFRDFQALRQMPLVRRVGNMVLGFMTKAAVGYWDCYDPCNGYVAIRGSVLKQIPLDSVGKSFFFEQSMLAQLYMVDAVVCDVPMPARYGNETTHLSIGKVAVEFPFRLLRCLCKRILLKHFIFDFSMVSIYLLTGLPMLLLGIGHGAWNWWHYGSQGLAAPTGTVVIPAMLIILAFQLLLSAIQEDMRRVPQLRRK